VTHVKRFAQFWWDFVVGDDWRVAVIVIAAVALAAVLGQWWPLPVATAGVLGLSVWRAARG